MRGESGVNALVYMEITGSVLRRYNVGILSVRISASGPVMAPGVAGM
jgi:hypothetical protein